MNTIRSGADFFKDLLKAVKQAKKSILIISPYISKNPVESIIENLPTKQVQLRFITLPPGIEYVTGSVDPSAIELLSQNQFEVSFLQNIHVKLYVIDDQIAYIGSANCTNRGLGLTEESNIEIMTKMFLTEENLSVIESTIVDKSYNLSIHTDWVEEYLPEYKSLQEQYVHFMKEFQQNKPKYHTTELKMNGTVNDPIQPIDSTSNKDTDLYGQFLSYLQNTNIISNYDHLNKGYGKQTYMIDEKHVIKVFKSKGQDATQIFEQTYRFSISKVGVEAIKSNKINSIVFILGNTKQFISIPRTFMEKTFFAEKLIDRTKRSWQFQISYIGQHCYIRCINGHRNKQNVYDVTKYDNRKLNYYWNNHKTIKKQYKKIREKVKNLTTPSK